MHLACNEPGSLSSLAVGRGKVERVEDARRWGLSRKQTDVW